MPKRDKPDTPKPKPFNPLEKKNLGESVAEALLAQAVEKLPPAERFSGAGVYAIYYTGGFDLYAPLAEHNRGGRFEVPIYVGKAIPAGARKGGLGLDLPSGNDLHKRLSEHAGSVRQAKNLEAEHFFCRYLIVDDIWIPLGESLLIDRFAPLWNQVIDGFGNHHTGSGRYEQQVSPWDILHPGRSWAEKLKASTRTQESLKVTVQTYMRSRFNRP